MQGRCVTSRDVPRTRTRGAGAVPVEKAPGHLSLLAFDSSNDLASYERTIPGAPPYKEDGGLHRIQTRPSRAEISDAYTPEQIGTPSTVQFWVELLLIIS